MAFDGVVTKSIVKELKEKVLGARIDKIYQPEKDEISIILHNHGSNHRLLLSASSNNPRVYLSSYSKKNPKTPPMFCMLLRKHLLGGIILNIEQFSMDRIIFIDISSVDELGEDYQLRLVIEIMGRHSNIILINKSNNKIIDSIIRVDEDMSRIRQILPGLIYNAPPLQGKVNPLNTSKDEFLNFINNSNHNLPIFKFLYLNYLGLSPLISKEICHNANLDIDRIIGDLENTDINSLYSSLQNLNRLIINEQFEPMYITDDLNKVIAFYALNLNQFGNGSKHFSSSISDVLDTVYRKKDTSDRLLQKSQNIKKSIQVKLDRTTNKLVKQKNELLASQDRNKFKIYADLISANIHLIPRGVTEIELENFYDKNLKLLKIPLDKKLSPAENAQKYYKRYSKLKNAESLLLKQIPETKSEISYLEHVLTSIENAIEVEDLEEIRAELISEGYLRDNRKQTKKRSKQTNLSSPLHYKSKDGFDIYVGKNNRQNEYLTLRFANHEDIWLHVQNIPGSHVIIRTNNKSVPSNTLEEAAILASYFSKARYSSNIPVDFTARRNVKKIRQGKPGMVNYDNFKTINVTPSKDRIDKIQKI